MSGSVPATRLDIVRIMKVDQITTDPFLGRFLFGVAGCIHRTLCRKYTPPKMTPPILGDYTYYYV